MNSKEILILPLALARNHLSITRLGARFAHDLDF